MSKKPNIKTRVRQSPEPDIFVVPVSGGKDSQLVLSNAVREYGPERVIAIHNYTGIDHPLTMRHLDYMQETYGVRIEHTANPKYRDMWDLLDKKTMIPGRVARFCTDELKIQATNHWLSGRTDLRRLVFLMGMRTGESVKRAESYAGFEPGDEFSYRDLNPHKVWAAYKHVRARLPIVNLSTAEVFETLRQRGEKVNPLYTRGHKRVGCYPCILAGKRDYRLAARDPAGHEVIFTLANFKDMVTHFRGIRDPSIILEHDLDEILAALDDDPFGFYAADDDDGIGCQWCAM